MPPTDPLSVRDGRTTPPPPSLPRRDQYYSNEEIQIMYHAVKRGHEIQLADAKGYHTGVSALFQGAQQIFPQYGISVDDPKMSALVFKIGSKRGVSEGLPEKFRSVLEGMGIEITLDGELFTGHDDGPEMSSPLRVAPSVRSVNTISSVSTNLVPRGVFPIAANLNGRRRRNSDTVATEALESIPQYAVPPRRRAASLVSSPTSTERPPLAALPPSLGQKDLPILSKWLLGNDAHSGPAVHVDGPPKPSALGGGRPQRALSIGDDSSLDADEVVPDLSGAQDGWDDGYEHHMAHHNKLSLRAGNLIPPEDASQEADVSRNGETMQSDMDRMDGDIHQGHLLPSPMSPFPSDHGLNHEDGPRYNPDLAAYLNRKPQAEPRQPPSYAASNVVQGGIPKPPWLPPSHANPLMTHSAVPPSLHRPKPEPRLEDMEPKLQLFEARQLEGYLIAWRDSYERQLAFVHSMNTWAFTLQRRNILTRNFKLWRGYTWNAISEGLAQRQRAADAAKQEAEAIRREAEIARQSAEAARLEAEAVIRKAEVARREAESARIRDRMMRRAARAADLSLLHKAFTHWGAAASKEAERTEIARRHLLRKKVFGAWSEKVSADQTKVRAFATTGLLGAWRDAVAHRRERNQLTGEMYLAALAKTCFSRWRQEHQARAAEAWHSTRLVDGCARKWKDEFGLARRLYVAAEEDAVHTLRASSLQTWRRKTAEAEALVAQSSIQLGRTQLSDLLGFWRRQAGLEGRLRKAATSREQRIMAESASAWRLSTQAVQRQEQSAKWRSAREFARHWALELELKLFRENADGLTLLTSIYKWVLAERMKLLRRFYRNSAKESALRCLRAGYAKEKRRKRELGMLAKVCYRTTLADASVGAMRRQLGQGGWMEDEARRMDSAQVTGQAVELWAAQTAEHDGMHDAAQRGAFYVGAVNCLEAWPRLAKAARQDRLKSTYLAFRRTAKINRRASCLTLWREAAYEKAVAGWEFERSRQEQLLDETVEWLNEWIGETNRMIGMDQTAGEVRAEAVVGAWRVGASRLAAGWADAAAYEVEAVAAARLEDWELKLVTIRGREHTASGLAEKHRRRQARQALGFWLGQVTQARRAVAGDEAAAGGAKTPLRSSLRRSQAATAPPAFAVSPFLPPRREGGSSSRQTGTLPPPTPQPPGQRPQRPHSLPDWAPAQAPDPLLGLSSDARSRPQQKQSLGDVPLGSSSYLQPMPPSWSGASRFSQSTSAPFTPQQEPHRQQQQQQRNPPERGYAYPTPAGPRDSVLPPISERSEASSRAPNSMRQSAADAAMGPGADRLKSFREKLASASRFVDSVQLGPMSADFDDDDDEDEDEGAPKGMSLAPNTMGRGPATAAATRRPSAAVMDTPTRWTGMPKPLPATRRAEPAPTTTPMAPLPSPMERQLRREYAPSATLPLPGSSASASVRGGIFGGSLGSGAGGISRPSKLGRSWTAAGRPPRVTFSGIDQDSDVGSVEDM